MKNLVLRLGRLAIGAGVSAVAAFSLAGCAWQAMESGYQQETRLAEKPAAKEPEVRAASAKPKAKVAEAKKSSADTAAAKKPPAQAAGSQDETSCVDVDKCVWVLKTMVADPDRSWMQRPAAPAVLANGVRLFAYRALRPTLGCSELAAALTEIETAAHAFSGPIAGLKPEQTSRVRTLSVEVGGELQAESARRCGPGSKGGSVG
jgi:hypothetical protein